KSSQRRAPCGVHASSAMAGRRGRIMYSAAVTFRTVSVQSGASTPTMFASVTPGRYVAGSHSYDVRGSTKPDQSSPSSVFGVYFMSRYTFGAGDMMSFDPYDSAPRAESVRHSCTSVVGS